MTYRPSRRDLMRIGAAAALVGCERGYRLPSELPQRRDPITSNEDFYQVRCCGTPDAPPDWALELLGVTGDVLASLTLDDLAALGTRDKEHTLECIHAIPAAQRISNAIWQGLPLREVLDAVGVEVPAEAVELVTIGLDDYRTPLFVEDLDDGPIWLVWGMNGEPLPREHGAPARLLVPGRYGMKNAKWLTGIQFADTPQGGYWEDRNWSKEAVFRPHGFIWSPRRHDEVKRGAIKVLGTAFAGRDPIALVELSTDGGATYEEATIDYSPGPDIWTLWSYDWEPSRAGEYTLKVRVTTESGATSHPSSDGDAPLTGYNGSMELAVVIR